MNKPKLKKQTLPLLSIDLQHHEGLQAIADKQGIPLAELLTSHIVGMLEDDDELTLKIPRKFFDVFVRFFDGDEDYAKGSMLGLLLEGAANIDKLTKSLGE